MLAGSGALEDRLLERARAPAVAHGRARDSAARRAAARVVDRARGRARARACAPPPAAARARASRASAATAPLGCVDELAVVQDRDAEPLEPGQVEHALVLVDRLADERRRDREPHAGAPASASVSAASRPVQPPPQSATSAGPFTLRGVRIASQASITSTPGGGVSRGRWAMRARGDDHAIGLPTRPPTRRRSACPGGCGRPRSRAGASSRRRSAQPSRGARARGRRARTARPAHRRPRPG